MYFGVFLKFVRLLMNSIHRHLVPAQAGLEWFSCWVEIPGLFVRGEGHSKVLF